MALSFLFVMKKGFFIERMTVSMVDIVYFRWLMLKTVSFSIKGIFCLNGDLMYITEGL